MAAPHNEAAIEYSTVKANSDLDVVNLITRLLVSKEGAVLRRLVMTAVSVTINLFFLSWLNNHVLDQPSDNVNLGETEWSFTDPSNGF